MGGKPFFHFFEIFLEPKKRLLMPVDQTDCAEQGSNQDDESSRPFVRARPAFPIPTRRRNVICH